MGGRVALHLAIDHPDMVKALVLANSPAGLASPSPEMLERRRVWQELLKKGDIQAFVEMMTTGAFSPGFKERNPTEFEKYKGIKLQNRPGEFARVMQALAALVTPPDLSKVKCRVLLIVGEHDAYMNVTQGKLAQQAIAGSKLVIFPTGHATAIELPDEFNEVVMEFLSKQ